MQHTPRISAQRPTAELPGQDLSAAQPDRRSGQRVRTIYRVAHLITAADNGLARVFNISDEGLGLRTPMPLSVGEAVAVRLSEDQLLEGRVAWTEGLECGLELNEPIDSDALLRGIGSSSCQLNPRALRLKLNKPVISHSQLGPSKVILCDVSLRGMKIRHDGSLTEGLRVKVVLGSGLERQGVVRWSQEGIAGVMLLDPFSPSELGSIRHL